MTVVYAPDSVVAMNDETSDNSTNVSSVAADSATEKLIGREERRYKLLFLKLQRLSADVGFVHRRLLGLLRLLRLARFMLLLWLRGL